MIDWINDGLIREPDIWRSVVKTDARIWRRSNRFRFSVSPKLALDHGDALFRPCLVSAGARILHGLVSSTLTHRNTLVHVSSVGHHRIVGGLRDEKCYLLWIWCTPSKKPRHPKSCTHRVDCVSIIIVMTRTDSKDSDPFLMDSPVCLTTPLFKTRALACSFLS